MAIWMIHAALPGLNVPFYIEADTEPTHEQINAVWIGRYPDQAVQPLKDPVIARELPLRDAYPTYAQVEKLIVYAVPV